MTTMRRRLAQPSAVIAVVTALLIPATTAGAQAPHGCGGTAYNPANPDHVLYGRSAGTMIVDLTGHIAVGGGFVVFWDGTFVPGADGARIIGSGHEDVICGTHGDDWIWGKQGRDRIFGFGSANDYDESVPGGDRLGDHLFGGRGDDLITNGFGVGFAELAAGAALIGGGRGDDTLYSGNGSSGTPTVRGGIGDDTLYGGLSGSGHVLRGGDGDDSVNLWGLDDSRGFGDAGDDTLTSRWGFNLELSGNTGDDLLIAGWGDYLTLSGGSGNDTLDAGTGHHQALFGNGGGDVIRGSGAWTGQVVDGGTGNDTITPPLTP